MYCPHILSVENYLTMHSRANRKLIQESGRYRIQEITKITQKRKKKIKDVWLLYKEMAINSDQGVRRLASRRE